MKIAISQPTFLSWQGYFALIDYVDSFVFFDNVQFVKRSWIQRNKIKSNNKELFLTIPVKTKGKRFQKIKEVEIDYDHFNYDKFLKTLTENYKNAQYFEKYFHEIENIFKKKDRYLSNLNISLIKKICHLMGIHTKFQNSSEIEGSDKFKNVDLIEHISQKLSASEYISTIGSKDYMGDINKLPNISTKVFFFEYLQLPYKQLNNNFLPYLSIIDLLLNEGENSLDILRKNFKIIKKYD